MSIIFDPFTDDQEAQPTSTIISNTYLPAGRRILSGFPTLIIQDINMTDAGVWTYTLNTNSLRARLAYDNFASGIIDISGLSSIQLTGVSSPGPLFYEMRLFDIDSGIPAIIIGVQSGQTVNFSLSGLTINLTRVREIDIFVDARTAILPITGSADQLIGVPIPCLAANTQILMADGTTKEIQKINRNDLVAANVQMNSTFRVARLLIDKLLSYQNNT